ncbi:hypothetical protein AA12717_3766 [Gluconacetobacter sacchari DSM 12717]|uniref:Uncharacterized protein n=2 Tax=Gluconacetobacter sacchari TaxID=92759 RepID=A0A7W4IA07_9PROT|nr:hypothetical protein [Gluconacetobacter sacchari]MBB2159002.1 hypothetical protein [Gluconacetobacter sacchari]GBQ31440.1 hypothetical protein AA12717_3766 [Gluconacetobacter sacchari DSM 12717]
MNDISSIPVRATANDLHSHLVAENEIKRLLYMVPRRKNNATVLQFIASQAGVGTSSITREFAAVAGGDMGISTLILSLDESTALTDEGLAQKYHLSPTLLSSPDADPPGPDWVRFRMVRDSTLTFAMTAVDQQKHPIDWITQIQTWRSCFDLILIDAPPLKQSYLGVALASQVDASIIIIGAEDTNKSDAKDLIFRIEELKGNIIGAILNKRRHHIPKALYNLPI